MDFFPVAGGRGSRLTLDPARPDDSGFYVCNTRNAFGSDVTTRHLLVLGERGSQLWFSLLWCFQCFHV